MARKEKREVWRALKQLAFFAVCCLALLVVLPNSANAATEDEVTVIASGGSLSAEWTLDSNGVLTLSGEGMMFEYDRETLIPPWKEYGEQVKKIIIEPGITNIGKYAFYDCRNVTEVEIGASVESIGDRAFGSDYLTEVRIPARVKRMGEKAFAAARVENGFWVDEDNGYFSSDERGVLFDKEKTILIKAPTKLAGAYTVPDTVETMKGSAFNYCKELTELTISDSVTNIEEYAVLNCTKLQTISIGDGMTDLGSLLRRSVGLTGLKTVNLGAGLKSVYNAGDYFSYLPTLQEINVSNENPTYASSDGVLYSKDMTELIAFPIGRTGSFQIPEGVTRIAGSGFYRSSLTNITIPNTVTSVTGGFRDCKNLEEMIFPDALIGIPTYCFSGCSVLKRVYIPDTCHGIGENTFENCTSLTEITLPKELNKIGRWAFKGCSTLSKVTFQGSCPASFDSSAFSGVTAVCYYPDNDLTWTDEVKKDYEGTLTWIAYEVNEFEGEEHTYTLPDTDITLAYQVDEAQKTAMITLCNTDAKGALEIPESIDGYTVVAIGPSAFQKCIGLTSVVVPDTVTEIGEAAFRNCTALASAKIPNTITSIKPYTFYNCALTDFEFPDGLVEIGDYAFQQLKMTSLTLPESVSIVGTGAFQDSSLRDVTLPDSLTYIPDLMFSGSHYLKTVDLPKTIITIGKAAFASCFGLHSMVLPEGLISIGESAFSQCGASRLWGDYYPASSFNTVTLPSTLQRIGEWAFSRCESLHSIAIPDKVTRIEDRTFAYTSGLGNVTLSANLTSIGEDAFLQSGVDYITFRWSAPEIYRDSFDSITATCYYPSNNEAWTSDMFQNYGAKSLTWVGQEMDKPEGVGGGEGGNPGGNEGEDSGETGGSGDPIDVKVDNETSSGAGDSASITPPEKGWTSGTNTFSVSGSQPCLVAISRDGGATYERLPATKNEDGSYSFTAENMTADTSLSVLLLGDVNGDGKVNNLDAIQAHAACLDKIELNARQTLVADINGNGKLEVMDITQLRAAILGKISLSW